MTTRSTLLYGPASATLLDHVNEGKPDMVGVYANLRGPLQTVIYGSTSRSLAIGSRHSILFAKGEIAPSGPLTALVAVDHSPYGAKCLGRFQQLKPTGIKKVVFVTAIDPEIADNRVLRHHLQGLETDLKQWVSAHYAKKCEDLASEFRKLGIETDYEVSDGHANDVIHRAMANHAADLLVLGAQGHSFIQRLTIGSVSMHQVTSETYPTLLMRT